MDGEITPDEVKRLLEEDDADVRIVDIRSRAAFGRGHIPGSENIPFAELPERIDSLSGAERVVTVCPHGKASVQAARLITSYEGTNAARVESMADGLDGWEYELATDEGSDGSDASAAPF